MRFIRTLKIVLTLLLLHMPVSAITSSHARAQSDTYKLVLLPDTQYFASEYPDVLQAQP